MGKRILLALLLLAVASLPGMAADADCRCLANGSAFSLGEVACIRTANGSRLARCEMFLNNTSWKVVAESCPTAMLVPSPANGHSEVAATTGPARRN